MKNSKILTALLVFFTLLSCCNDDDKQPTDKISGEWRLARVSGGFTGGEQVFTGNTIVWKFNPNNKTIIVTNGNTDETIVDGLDSGSYSYSMVDNNDSQQCAKTILINNTENYGCITVTESQLKINNTFADGHLYEFYRKEILLND